MTLSVAAVTALGDDALVAAQRMCGWCTRAPSLEEELALANIALDLLGQARAFLTHAGSLQDPPRDEDTLAFRRDSREFTNVLLVELDDADFAVTVVKLLAFSAYQLVLYDALRSCGDPVVEAVAVRAARECRYHHEHARLWTARLGDGTAESGRRMAAALDHVWPYTAELFHPWPELPVDHAALRREWSRLVDAALADGRLAPPAVTWEPRGGRQGLHTEALGLLLAEMQSLHRAHEGVTW